MLNSKIHTLDNTHKLRRPAGKTGAKATLLIPSVVDIYQKGQEILNKGKWSNFLETTGYNPAVGYKGYKQQNHSSNEDLALGPTETAFDNDTVNLICIDSYEDLHKHKE
jgi:hypothetical protein